MAGVPKRATHAEQALTGRAFDRDVVEAAMAALEQDFTPMTDMRASAGYRLQAARNMLLKYWLERTGNPLRLTGTAAGHYARPLATA